MALRSRASWRAGATAQRPAWPEGAPRDEGPRFGRQTGQGDGQVMEGHGGAVRKATRRG